MIDHIIATCPFSREVWFYVLQALRRPLPAASATSLAWWRSLRSLFNGDRQTGMDTLFALVSGSCGRRGTQDASENQRELCRSITLYVTRCGTASPFTNTRPQAKSGTLYAGEPKQTILGWHDEEIAYEARGQQRKYRQVMPAQVILQDCNTSIQLEYNVNSIPDNDRTAQFQMATAIIEDTHV